MKRNSQLLSVCFCAGLLAAIVSTVFAWLCSHYGLNGLAGVNLTTSLSATSLYPRMIWGGVWGLAFALTVIHLRTRKHWVRKGMVVSLAPTLYQLFVIYPYQTPYGPLGIELGLLIPLFIFIFNLVWGIFAGFFARLLWGRS